MLWLGKKYICGSYFKKSEPRAYKAAQKYGWLKEYDWFIPHYHAIKWTYETCYSEALKYSSRIEFENGNESAYKKALRLGWLDDYSWMILQQKPKGFWEKIETVREEALKYTSRVEFYRKNQTAYQTACKKGWMDLLYQHKTDSSENKRTVYSYEFPDFNTVYVGLTIDKNRRHLQHRGEFGSKNKSAVLKFSRDNGIPVPEPIYWFEECTIEESKIREKEVLDLYKEDGWLVLNKSKTGEKHSSLGASEYKWTKNSCYSEALKYRTRKEFSNAASAAYIKAKKRGWIDDYFWFKTDAKRKWTRGTCYEEAKKYKTRGDFCLGNHSAYQIASRNKWLNDYFWFIKTKPKHPPRKWWYKSCKEEALKYKNRSEFAVKSKGAYEVSRVNGWLDEFFPFKHKNQFV